MPKTGASSRVESMAVTPDRALRVARYDCETCGKETLFRGLRCLTCNVYRKLKDGKGKAIDYSLKSMRGFAYKVYLRNIRADRMNGIHKAKKFVRQAAESRARFEGKEVVPVAAPSYSQDDVKAFLEQKAKAQPAPSSASLTDPSPPIPPTHAIWGVGG